MTERYYRRTAVIVGALFIIATVASLAGANLIVSQFDEPDNIMKLPDIENDVMMAAFFETILAASLIGIGALMYPVLKKHGEGLGMAYAGIRLVEATFIVIGTVCLLGMLSIGQDYVSGSLDENAARSIGALLTSLREGALLFGTLIFLSLGGLSLNYLLYRSRLVPRWLSVWGLIGAVGILIYGMMGLFGTDTQSFDIMTLMAVPIGIQEMVFASWLIIKGFDTPSNYVGEVSDLTIPRRSKESLDR